MEQEISFKQLLVPVLSVGAFLLTACQPGVGEVEGTSPKLVENPASDNSGSIDPLAIGVGVDPASFTTPTPQFEISKVISPSILIEPPDLSQAGAIHDLDGDLLADGVNEAGILLQGPGLDRDTDGDLIDDETEIRILTDPREPNKLFKSVVGGVEKTLVGVKTQIGDLVVESYVKLSPFGLADNLNYQASEKVVIEDFESRYDEVLGDHKVFPIAEFPHVGEGIENFQFNCASFVLEVFFGNSNFESYWTNPTQLEVVLASDFFASDGLSYPFTTLEGNKILENEEFIQNLQHYDVIGIYSQDGTPLHYAIINPVEYQLKDPTTGEIIDRIPAKALYHKPGEYPIVGQTYIEDMPDLYPDAAYFKAYHPNVDNICQAGGLCSIEVD